MTARRGGVAQERTKSPRASAYRRDVKPSEAICSTILAMRARPHPDAMNSGRDVLAQGERHAVMEADGLAGARAGKHPSHVTAGVAPALRSPRLSDRA